MVKFDGRIVQFGFGAVGKSFYEKVSKEIQFNEKDYYVITMDRSEFHAYVNLGGLVANFIVSQITKENFIEIFSKYLKSGDLLIDFADTVGTKDICQWCAENNIMYLNTGEADWPDRWYSIFEENLKKLNMKENCTNNCPIVLQHGNNPGLVSHFVKTAISYIVESQFKSNKELKKLIKEGRFNEVAMKLGVKMIHVNDIDLQQVLGEYDDNILYSTWCTDTFWFEMLSEATANIGTHEKIDFIEECNLVDYEKGFLEFKNLAADKKCKTYYPGGEFRGYLVPHEETITIAQGLEVKENDNVIYRPSVMFIYSPCEYATKYFNNAKTDDEGENVVRGYEYPANFQIVYKEKIKSGTEYVGVLLLGDGFKPVWVGNRVEPSFLYKDKKSSFWQTPTITPVAMSALAATCWMIKNKDKGGIYFPDDIKDYKYILKVAEKYISKTIYKTFSKEVVEENLGININNVKLQDVLVK
ncbi:MAG: saccharopine dehydrogenase NADP-binding domain-containing protein [Lachnospiraceae bacterium]|nr:saccharopine dehydrogenase NADP-binding domain-containing protein [Lachnospiraceae bacterium]